MGNQTNAKRRGGFPSAQVQPALNPFLGLIPRELWKRPKDFFVYSATFTGAFVLPASGAASLDIQIDANADFLIMAGVRTFRDTGTGALQTPAATVTLTDSASGRQLQNEPQDVENLFGTAQLPAVWPFPKLIARSATLTVALANLIATASNARVAFLGFKIFGGSD